MSFILDALRKAEHNKSEHQSLNVPSPTILNDELPTRPRSPVPSGLLWILPGMLMLAFGIWALLPKKVDSTEQMPAQATQPSTQSVAGSAQVSPTQINRTAAQVTPQSSFAAPTANNATPTPTTVTRRDTGARALDQVARQGQLRQPSPASQQPTPTRSSTSTELPRPQQRGSVTTLDEQPRSNITPGTVTIAPEGVDLSDNTALNRPTTLPSPATNDNPSTGSVSAEVLPEYRSAVISGKVPLPEISLDMHVYSNTPAKRFVFVNLNKLGEGERLEDGTSIEEILPDGAVLNHKGFRFIIRPD